MQYGIFGDLEIVHVKRRGITTNSLISFTFISVNMLKHTVISYKLKEWKFENEAVKILILPEVGAYENVTSVSTSDHWTR